MSKSFDFIDGNYKPAIPYPMKDEEALEEMYNKLSKFYNETPIPTKPYEEVPAPAHYDVFPGVEAIEIIARSLTEEQFYGYCLGNVLKYRLRVGKKDAIQKELYKAEDYIKLYEEYKHCCIRNADEILL